MIIMIKYYHAFVSLIEHEFRKKTYGDINTDTLMRLLFTCLCASTYPTRKKKNREGKVSQKGEQIIVHNSLILHATNSTTSKAIMSMSIKKNEGDGD